MFDSSRTSTKRIIESGRDFYYIDENGQKYLDGIANMWCNVWGFDENRITSAMIDQIRKIPHSTIFGLSNDKSIELSKKFLKLTKGMDKVFYIDNGSSAIESALKMATQYWNNKGNDNKSIFLHLRDVFVIFNQNTRFLLESYPQDVIKIEIFLKNAEYAIEP